MLLSVVHVEKNNDGMQQTMDKLLCNVRVGEENSFLICFRLATEEMKKLATDAMFKLEYEGKDVAKKSTNAAPDLTELEMHQSAWKDDYIINYVLRKNLRVQALKTKISNERISDFSRKSNAKIVYKKKPMIV